MLKVHNLLLVGSLVLFAGCGTTKSAPHSGFLGDYSNFRESKVVEDLMVDKHKYLDLDSYAKFIIEPVEVHLHPGAVSEKFDASQLDELANYFEEQIRAALAQNYTVVSEPQEGALIIRTAITDVVPNKVALNLHWSTTMTGLGIGGASLEVEFLDSMTKERILAVVDSKQGKKMKLSKGWSKWGHTKGVFEEWINLFIARMDQLHKPVLAEAKE